MANDKQFVNGLYLNSPRETRPDFVIVEGSIHRERMIEWLQSQRGEWISIEANRPKNPKEDKPRRLTVFVDDYKKDEKQENSNGQSKDDFDDDIPF